MKMVGWTDMNVSSTFIFYSDDGLAVSIGNGGTAFNGSTWLGGTSNLHNQINAWFLQPVNVGYSFTHSAGTFRFESDYYEDGGAALYWQLTNTLVNYYHAALPPNNVIPTNTYGTYSLV